MIIKFILHILFGAAASISMFLLLIAGFDALADGITLFVNPGEIAINSFIVFVVSVIILAVNMWRLVRYPWQ